jgi:hypothetical protein
MLYCTVLYCAILYCTVLYCAILYYTVLYCAILYCTVLYCAILYYTVLYCAILCYTVLYCTVLYCIRDFSVPSWRNCIFCTVHSVSLNRTQQITVRQSKLGIRFLIVLDEVLPKTEAVQDRILESSYLLAHIKIKSMFQNPRITRVISSSSSHDP